MATEKLFDMMFRMAAPYGSTGLTSYAISAVDLALWDLKGKLLNRPVYELLGGPQKESIFCYSTGFETEWYMELGFEATKLPLPYGPADGLEGLNKNEVEVARTRELIGDNVELMLDCWLSLDVEYTIRLAERLKPYRLKWIEDYLIPEDFEGFAQVRQRLPWQTLATGRTLVYAVALFDGCQPTSCGYIPAGCIMGGRNHVVRSDLSPRRSRWHLSNHPWRHELSLRTTSRVCDARHPLG